MIIVSDPIYGTFEMPDIFAELLRCDAVRRLDRIHHSGAIFLVNPEICHTRLEHSIGVMLLIKLLGGSEIEQVAGLLHDVSHTAFSHVGDYIFDCREEDYHEKLYSQIIMDSDIPEILIKYGYDIEEFLTKTFSLLEQPLPQLCADRLDYTLRDAMHTKIISRRQAMAFLEVITTQDGKIVVNDEVNAGWIDQIYSRLNKEIYNWPLYVYANQQLALLIKDAMNIGDLLEGDLMRDDVFLLRKIRSSAQGSDALDAIGVMKDFETFLESGATIKIKERFLKSQVSTRE